MTPYPITTDLALRLTLARQRLAKGDSLSQVAQACGMGRGELDVWLWRTLGTPVIGGKR